MQVTNVLVAAGVDTTEWYMQGATFLLGCDQNGSISKHVSGLVFRHMRSGKTITELINYAPPGKVALKFGETVQLFDSPQEAYQYVLALESLEK